MNNMLPVTIVTGFLGSGKTTLINGLLHDRLLDDAALIVNEFGDVGIDQLLVETSDDGIIELSDGCICCTIRGDFVDTLIRIVEQRKQRQLDRIIVETTGLADPVPMLRVIMEYPELRDQLVLDGVITVVDAVNGAATLDAHEEAIKQVAVADRLVVTKTDLGGQHEALVERLGALNPAAPITVAQEAGFDRQTLLKPGQADFWAGFHGGADGEAEHGHHHHHSNHDSDIRSFSLVSRKATDQSTLAAFVGLLRSAHGPKLLRVKGIIAMKETPEQPVVIHGVQHVFHPPGTLDSWPSDDRRTRLVMITKGMSETFVRKLFSAFMGEVAIDTPDRQAFNANPLAIPGHRGRFHS